jgi:ABC-2 type transport system permease protein
MSVQAPAGEAGSSPMQRAPSISTWSRLYGFGSIYGKTIRDSRLAFIVVTGILAAMMIAAGAAMKNAFPTPESRLEVDKLIATIPSSLTGLFGNPIKVNTLGGVVNWKYGPFFAMGTGLWSILALSGTLAGEASRGSLDFVATTPLGKRRVALEKLGAHLTMMVLAMGILAFTSWLAATVYGDAALGDAIPPLNAIGFSLWAGLTALAAGGLAFALAPILGRSGSAAIAGAVMVGGYVINGYASSVPGFSLLANLSWFHWTAGQAPIVGVFDWPALALVAVVAVVFLALGVELFARRDVGVTANVPTPALPAAALGVRGPISRSFGDLLPRAVAWGIGLGLMGLVVASLTGTFADQIAKEPAFKSILQAMFKDFDITSPGGLLQGYAQILFVVAGLAGATFVSKWASDEGDKRLEMVLTTPLARARWAISGGIGGAIAAVVMTVLFALGIGIGAASAGTEAMGPMAGSAALGFYAAAVVGVGVAIGGVWRTSLAADLASLFVIATFLVDMLVPALSWPDWIHQFALTAHMGAPMIGNWSVAGLAACVAVAVIGIALGAWGMRRRDIG